MIMQEMGHTNKFTFNISQFSLYEVCIAIWIGIILFIAWKTSWLVPVVLALLSTNIMFGFFLLIICCLAYLTPNGNKMNVLLPLLRQALSLNCSVYVNQPSNGFESRTIIVANYPASFIEYLLIPMLLVDQKSTLVIGSTAHFFARLFVDTDQLILLNKQNNFGSLTEKLEEQFSKNQIPIVFVEKPCARQYFNFIRPFRSGIFEIAKQNSMNIILAHVEHVQHNFGFISKQNLRVNFEKCLHLNAQDAHTQMVQLSQLQESDDLA